MLSLLHIENIAVIEQADIVFDQGFHVLTGETGAGKSIVIDAISAILGERTYRDVIRTGASKALVSAVFTDVPELPWFAENFVPYSHEEVRILREISQDGRNLCKVNGQPVTVGILRQLGRLLINIHGQHDSQQLFDEERHLTFLDHYAEDEALLQAYSEKFQKVSALRQQIQHLCMDENEKQRRMETLRYQIQELEQANLQPGEDDALKTRQKVLQNSEKLMSGLLEAVSNLYGDENADGANSLLTNADYALSRIERYDEQIANVRAKLQDVIYAVDDVTEELRDKKDAFQYSEQELEQIETRLDLIHRLRRKYGATCEDMLAYLENAKQELDEIEFSDERLEKMRAELASAEQAAQETAQTLHDARQTAARSMEKRMMLELSQLDMPKIRFLCQFTPIPLSPTGADHVCFLMSANVGEALKPMNKVASGGELARIMLAMKQVLAEQDEVPTLIFDEVDTGVSGRAAQKVAEKLASVAKHKQVLCVTHLPQIAAMADFHLLIAKEVRQERTYTTVTPLDLEGRKHELARMIGGAVITDTTLRSAEEMLSYRK